jgi:hypothetical protein
MRFLALAVSIAALTGCSAPSMSEMRSQSPVQSYTSHKAEADIAKCILFAWQDTSLAGGNAQASIQPGRSGGSTVLTQGNEYFVDIAKQGSSTIIKYYEVGDTWISRKLRPGVVGCI